MSMVWDLFGIPANSNVPDTDGNVWTVRSSDGWDAPDQRTQLMSPTGLHGQRIMSQYAEGRAVVIKGLVLAPSDAAAWKAYDRITASMPGLSGSGEIIAYEPVPKVLIVAQAAPPRASKPLNRVISYQLTLLAEDPFKRAVTSRTTAVGAGASVAATNDGTAAADLVVTLTTAGTVVLTAGGLTLTTSSLPSGTVIDTGAGTITGPGGEDLFTAMQPGSQFPALPKGGGDLVNAGSASLSVTSHDTYA